jgi:hypothetical protein
MAYRTLRQSRTPESVLDRVNTALGFRGPRRKRTWYDICQGPQCRLDLRYGAGVLCDEVGIHPEPFRRHGQDRRRPLSRLFVHGCHCKNKDSGVAGPDLGSRRLGLVECKLGTP